MHRVPWFIKKSRNTKAARAGTKLSGGLQAQISSECEQTLGLNNFGIVLALLCQLDADHGCSYPRIHGFRNAWIPRRCVSLMNPCRKITFSPFLWKGLILYSSKAIVNGRRKLLFLTHSCHVARKDTRSKSSNDPRKRRQEFHSRSGGARARKLATNHHAAIRGRAATRGTATYPLSTEILNPPTPREFPDQTKASPR